ncbi:MAG: VWA domain-containing protein [Pseudomonadota bacterium]
MSIPGLPEALSFAWPWMAVAVVLPVVAFFVLPARTTLHHSALQVPPGSPLAAVGSNAGSGSARRWLRRMFTWIGWLALIAAAMRPQWQSGDEQTPVTGRNLMLAVDLSGSMEAKDFKLAGRSVDRLTATKAVGGDFIERREGDKLGLILFGERAYLQAPLTFDRDTLKTLLFEAAIGLAGEKTAIGDAIALAVKRVRDADVDGEQHVLVLLTDGANTAGNIEPLKAAELAAVVGLKIYTIGIGADQSLLQDRSIRRLVVPRADLDEQTLTSIAQLTGGRYFRARDTVGLADIYKELDTLEPAADEEEGLMIRDEVFHWPAAAALVLFAVPGFGGALRRLF